MWSPEVVALVIDVLNEIGSPYLVTGSVASNAYTEPRGTIDVDFVLEVRGDEISILRERLKDGFVAEDQMALETVTGKKQHRFRHRVTKFLVEVFEAKMDDPHERSRFERRKSERFAGKQTFYPTAEDVIVGKLRWYKQIQRPKDREDCVKVIRSQMKHLDWPYIDYWCREHGTHELLAILKQRAQDNLNESEQT